MKIHVRSLLRDFFTKGLLLGGLMFSCHIFAAEVHKSGDNSSAVISIPVTIINPQPTCDVSVQPSYYLGTLSIGGNKHHTAFPVTISCSGRVESMLKATMAGGSSVLLSDNYRVAVSANGQNVSSATGPFFWLQDSSNRPIKLIGRDEDAFCRATDQRRDCYITPVTRVNSDSVRGSKGAVDIILNVIYPA